MEYVWVEKDKSIKSIVNEEMKVHIKWSKNSAEDYTKLAKQYMNAGYIILKEIVEGTHNNIKYDMWFLPSVYMMRQAIELLIKSGIAINGATMRQAIELLIKSGIAINGATKNELQTIFIATKHNVKELYKIYKDNYGVEELNEAEQTWLEKYLDSIELIDSNSDLFRYPFKDKFMQQYGDKALDIVHMGNRLIYCYSTLNKMIYGKWSNGVELNVEEEPHFLQLTNTRINNCYLHDSPWSNGFHKQITGYSEVATFLFGNFKESKDEGLFYPIVFLMRNAIEIGLKRLLHMQMSQGVDAHIVKSKRNSHLLYKDLWRSIKPMLVHYSKEDNQKEEILELAESYIRSISSIDKHGDMFRYPCSYSNEYKFNDVEIDVANFYSYLLGLFHFIDGCDAWLDNIKDYEMEIRSEWESEMRSYTE